MKKILAAVLAGLFAWTAAALEYKTVDIRRTGNSPVRETFWAGDSIAFGYALEEDSEAYDLTPWDVVSWELCTYTNPAQCWMGVTGRVDDAESGELSVRTDLPLSVVPEGQYRGYVKGLQVTESNTVARQRVLVEQVVTVRYGQTEYPPDPEDTGDIIAGNAYVRQSALDAEAAARAEKDDLLEGAIKAISGDPAYYGGMVAKTNGLWVIDQQEGRTALEWNGTPVLEAVAPTNASETATGAVMVATAPLYVGEVGESNRVATLADVGSGGGGDYLPATREDEGEPWNVEDPVEFYGGVRLDSLAMGESVWHKLPTLADLNENDELTNELEKYGADVDAEDAWNFSTPNVPRWQGTNLATTADVARVAANVAENARGIASNRIGVAKVNDRIEGLWGECRGGWRWPDYFLVTDYYTGWRGGGTTNVSPPYATNTSYNVVETLALQEGLSGWNILTKTIRKANESDSIVWVPIFRRRSGRDHTGAPVLGYSMSPDLLETSGNLVLFREGVSAEDIDGSFAAVRGTLGDYTIEQFLDYDAAKQATNSTLVKFVGPAPGSFMAHCYSNILVAASNASVHGKDMGVWLWPQGYGSGTNHVPATINTNCWAYGMGDFSCVSYHTDTRPGIAGGTYRPLVMVTPRHAVCANHFKPLIGSNVYWVTKSGGIATNRVASYYNISGDLTVARLETPFDTNEVGTATLLNHDYYEFTYGSTNSPVHEMLGIPCLSFDCAERVRVSFWRPTSLWYGPGWTDSIGRGYDWYAGGFQIYAYNPYVDDEDYHGPYRGNGTAVGGDSGSPSFLIADGKCILLGCFYTAPGGGPMPKKVDVDAVIEDIWNDPERCQEYSLGEGGWYSPDRPTVPI
jgi:hypothetical protein